MDPEIAQNAKDFRESLAESLRTNIVAVADKNAQKLDEAYARLTCLQAIRTYLLEDSTSEGALGFFTEAQGDGLTSQVLILSGSSRSALKSLRSLIENVIRSVYYADHPIEYKLWELGKHRPSFKSLFEYLETHPDLAGLDPALQPAVSLHSNWKKLSQFVHASAKEERMSSKVDKITIWRTSQKSVGQWSTFQRAVLRDVSLLYLSLCSAKMQGASLKPMREAFSASLPSNLDEKVLENLGVKIARA